MNVHRKKERKFINHCLKSNKKPHLISLSLQIVAPKSRSAFYAHETRKLHAHSVAKSRKRDRTIGTENHLYCAVCKLVVLYRHSAYMYTFITALQSQTNVLTVWRVYVYSVHCVAYTVIDGARWKWTNTYSNTDLCVQKCHISRKKYVLTFILIFITSNWGLCAIN